MLWVGRTPADAPVAARARVRLADWAELDEVYVPPRARELARSLLDGGDRSPGG